VLFAVEAQVEVRTSEADACSMATSIAQHLVETPRCTLLIALGMSFDTLQDDPFLSQHPRQQQHLSTSA
jgi:hypothetical protein